MCEKLRYCARKIDPCIEAEVEQLRFLGLNTVSSCCGHGIYPKSIVYKDENGRYYEFFSGVEIIPQKRRHLNFYQSIWNNEERKRYYFLEAQLRLVF